MDDKHLAEHAEFTTVVSIYGFIDGVLIETEILEVGEGCIELKKEVSWGSLQSFLIEWRLALIKAREACSRQIHGIVPEILNQQAYTQLMKLKYRLELLNIIEIVPHNLVKICEYLLEPRVIGCTHNISFQQKGIDHGLLEI